MAIETLFGPSIADVQELRRLQAEKEIAGAGGQFGVFAPLYQASLRFGNQAVQGANTLLGAQDPMLKKATDIQGILTQYQDQDLTDANVLKKISKELSGKGYAAESLSLAQEAQQAATKQAALRKAELSEAQELKLRQELAALGPAASEDQVLAVVTKYGSPDKIMAALSAKQSREATRMQQREMQEQRLDLARMNFNFKMDLANQKNADKLEAKENKLNAAVGVADNVISVAKKSSDQVSGFTSGMIGKPLATIGVPAAVDLEENLNTIKANLGFRELQAMRDASPTGGALGQVAVKELDLLTSALTSLSNRQSPTQLKENLDKVVKHYTSWREAVMKSKQETQPSDVSGATSSLPAGVTVKRKGQ